MEKKGKSKTKKTETPLMKQYNAIKAKHPDAILLFRVGDFYETFGQDAVKTAKILSIVLTKRANGSASHIELAGFPHHALDNYLPMLVKAGERVAICDQLEAPSAAKKIVKRGVTELITPGVSTHDKLLPAKDNNFLCAIHSIDLSTFGIAFLDISTADFFVSEGDKKEINHLLSHFNPTEILYNKTQKTDLEFKSLKDKYTYPLEDWFFKNPYGYEKLIEHFSTQSLKGFGIEDLKNAQVAAGVVLTYLGQTHHDKIEHISSIRRINGENYLRMDDFTIRNLEIFPNHSGQANLLQTIDKTVSPMGGRLLRRWLSFPLKNKTEIDHRLSITNYFFDEEEILFGIREKLEGIFDLERLCSKLARGKIGPRELQKFRFSGEKINEIKELLANSQNDSVRFLSEEIKEMSEIIHLLDSHLKEEVPVQLGKGDVIADGVHPKLDEYRKLLTEGKDFLTELCERYIEETDIPSLKIAYNNVFGYYIEVRNTHKDKVPEEWLRKQTLVSSERYITDQLKEYEEKIIHAQSHISEIESNLYIKLLGELLPFIGDLQKNAKTMAELDCYCSFASYSKENRWTKPEITVGYELDIKLGRHPVIEKLLPFEKPYIPNDVFLDRKEQQVIIISGPNMSGKSAFLRQNALIVLLAQIGCFVPCKEAKIGVVDKIFTRVGASDNLSEGESTFMVEMIEAANILNNISERSLIILDEIGRGTSTFDGISIAWAITEYLHEHPFKPKTLFATHYHELNEMTHSFERIKNFHVTVKEIDNEILFLRKLQLGGSAHSFGLQVAKMAGIPNWVLSKADDILNRLESNSSPKNSDLKEVDSSTDGLQLQIFEMEDPTWKKIKSKLEKTNIDTLTPIEALMVLHEMKKSMS